MSVGDGFMIVMAAARTHTTTVASGDVTPRRRGKSKAPKFKYEGPVSVIRLELDVSDPMMRRRVELHLNHRAVATLPMRGTSAENPRPAHPSLPRMRPAS
jgi:hypothetical protein